LRPAGTIALRSPATAHADDGHNAIPRCGNFLLQGYSHHLRIFDLQFAHRPPPGANDAMIYYAALFMSRYFAAA
jgi:hypothetical protein